MRSTCPSAGPRQELAKSGKLNHKRRFSMRKNLVSLVIALIATPSMMAAVQPQIIIINNLPGPGFAPFSVVNSQTARINAYFGPQPHLNQPCDGVIQLRFFDSTGNVLAQR